jgi:hypothetical protein
MFRKEKKRKNWFRCIFSFTLLGIFIFVCVRYRAALLRSADTVRLIIRKPDIASVLHAVRREDFGIVCVQDASNADDCYVFDADGVIFDSARVVVGDVIARVDDASDFKPALGAMFVDDAAWRAMKLVIAYVKEHLPVSRMEYARAEGELDIILTDSGTRIMFDLSAAVEEHINALKELVKTVPLSGLQYVDLRTKGRLFYK